VSQSIRTPDQRLRVFVSSTLQELADERLSAKEAIQRIRLTPVMFEMGARPHPPRDLYRAYLAQSDIFIGIYWQRYGWIAPNETVSGLEDEYRLARHMPMLIYIKRADTRDAQLKDLIGRIQDEDKVSYRPFSDAEELRDLIENDLALMLTERFNEMSAGFTTDSPREPIVEAPPRSSAPVERGELIGREAELDLVTELLQQADTGLITLTGPGGTGKTRLAIHLANSLESSFEGGTFYVPLAGVRNAGDVVTTIVSTLDIPSPPTGGDPEKLLFGFLRARRALLVLDNFEQVLEAAVHVADLLGTCPHLKVLATSRQPLHIWGEREVPVPPLPHVFQAGGDVTPAMRLFEKRAREVRPDFTIDDDNRSAVAELCRRLDALPLAIELAAARVRVLSPQAMVPRLAESLSLLAGATRDLPERHQTLRATLEWSLDLLRPEEKVFFRRLGVFAGSFSEEAAAAVVADAGLDVLDGLTSLVEQNLLVHSEMRGEARFQMLETVREFARELVASAGEERAARLRHGVWVLEFLTGEDENVLKIDMRQVAHDRIVSEETGIRQALRFAASADGDPELAWQLFIRFGVPLMTSYARTTEVLETYERLQALPPATDPLTAARVLGIRCWARAALFDFETEPDCEAVCTMLEEAGEREFLPGFQAAWGTVVAPSSPSRSFVILDRALVLAREMGQTVIENWALMTICYRLLQDGEVDEAQRYAEQFSNIGPKRNDDEAASYAIAIGARVKLMRGDLGGARSMFAEAASLALARSAAWARLIALSGLASVTLAAGEETDARAILEEVLLFSVGMGYVSIDSGCGAMALLLVKAGERDRALHVFEAVGQGAENEISYAATLADPSGALRTATGEARALLGDPPPRDAADVDLEAVLRAALGHGETEERAEPG
jgi:predicted ATPase